MTIQGREELFDDKGNIAVWGKVSSSGKPFYTFQLTNEDKYILFPQTYDNPKGPKFILKKVNSEKGNATPVNKTRYAETEEIPF